MDFLLETTWNQILLYILHFLWALFDWIIFSSFFITWEIFFVSWWYLSANYLNFFICYIFLVIWASLWDNISYFIWKKYWNKVLKWKQVKFLNEKQIKKWSDLLNKHWVKIIFFSRFVWPFYWIIPTISWIIWFDYKKFFFFNLAWISVWVLQFMTYWYFFAIWFSYFWNSVFINILLIITFIYFLYLFYLRIKLHINDKKYHKIFLEFLKYFLLYTLIFIIILFYYFFYLYPKESVFYDENQEIKNISLFLEKNDKKIFSDKIIKTNSNPINLVLITNKNLDSLMNEIWWKKNLSFSSSQIDILKFWELFFKKEPPISDYYHNWFNQNFQYQDFSKSSRKRNHIRFWKIWKTKDRKNIYLSSISKDKNYSIMINNWLPIIWHSIYKNIDYTRDYFIEILKKNFEKININYIKFPEIKEKNYFSDWKIFILEI